MDIQRFMGLRAVRVHSGNQMEWNRGVDRDTQGVWVHISGSSLGHV